MTYVQRTEFSGKTDSIFLALMFGNLIWLLFWSYVGSIKPNLKVPIFPNLEYIFQSPEKIFLWSPLCFFLHFSKRTVEGTIYWQNTDFFTKNQSPDRISPEFGTFKSRKFRSLLISSRIHFKIQNNYQRYQYSVLKYY
jgi:hypothetical protein